MANEASVLVVMRARDEASTKLKTLGNTAQQTGEQFRTALPALATLGSSLASLLITTGALNSETGRYVTTGLALTSAAASAVPAIAALVRIFQSLNIAMRAQVVLQSILRGLMGPVGIATVVAALGVGTAAYVATRQLTGAATGQPMVVNIDQRGMTVDNGARAAEVARQTNRAVTEAQRRIPYIGAP